MSARVITMDVKKTGEKGDISYLEIAATHMHANGKVIGSLSCANIDSSNISIKKCLVVHSSGFHLSYHLIITEKAERWVINLYMSYRNDFRVIRYHQYASAYDSRSSITP